MKITQIPELTKLNTTPLAAVSIKDSSVVVDADDQHELRRRFVLRPYQAVRMTTADCFSLPEGVSLKPNEVIEVLDSQWIHELKANLSRVDETATFMSQARHFVFPLQDDILEVIAWGIEELLPTPESVPSTLRG